MVEDCSLTADTAKSGTTVVEPGVVIEAGWLDDSCSTEVVEVGVGICTATTSEVMVETTSA
jgi:hypothetical protein